MEARIEDAFLMEFCRKWIQQFNRLLEQRNGLLKIFFDQNFLDEDLLETYSEPLLFLIKKIYLQRHDFMQRFVPIFKKHYENLSEGREQVEIIYESEVANEEFEKDFRRNRQRDMQSQRTNKGVHKDDYVFEINGFAVRKFGSQGQQKSFVMALKLAQFELLEEFREVKPILLLDDIFDKLDDRRIEKLIQSIDNQTFGQVFITDARPERTAKILEKSKAEIKICNLMNHDN
jgi:DNA replication and repair protein RecF